MTSAKLISRSENLRTGDVTLELDLGKKQENVRLSAIKILNDNNIMQQLTIEDRQRVAYWAGVEDARTQQAQYQLLKQLLSTPAPVKKNQQNKNRTLKNA